MTAQIQFPAAPLNGTFTATVRDNNGAPVTVLEASAPIQVGLEWRLDAATATILGGQWRVSGYFESMGGGPEGTLFNTAPIAANGSQTYSTTGTVPAGTFPNNPGPGAGGIYKLVFVLLLINNGNVTNVAAVEEGPVVRIG